MLNFSTKSLSQNLCKRKLPPCSCTQCKLLREGNKPEQHVNNLCAKIALAYQSAQNEERKHDDLKPDSELPVDTDDIIECVKEIRKNKLKEEQESKEKSEKSNQNFEQPNESLKETAQPEQANDNAEEAAQLEQSQVEVNAPEIVITASEKEQFGIKGLFNISSLTMPSFDFKPENFQSFLFEIVGILAFFTFIITMFWITIVQYSWHFTKIILSSGKKAQLIALILFLILIACIIYHAVQGKNHFRDPQNTHLTNDLQKPVGVRWPPKCYHRCCEHRRHSQYSLKTSISSKEHILTSKDSLCSLCSLSNDMINSRYIECAHETPTGFFNRIKHSIANTFSRFIHPMSSANTKTYRFTA